MKIGETYTFNVFNKSFSSHIPHISTDSIGGSVDNEVLTGVVNYWQTGTGREYIGNPGVSVLYDYSDGIKAYSMEVESEQLQKTKIEFTPASVGTFYLQDANFENVGIELSVEEDYGEVINPEELYHLMLLRRTNRLYNYDYSSEVLSSFLKSYIPAGIVGRITNLPPIITGWINNKEIYNGGDSAVLAVAHEDPEDDIMTYQWSHVGVRTTDSGLYTTTSVGGSDLSVSLNNTDGYSCWGTLTTPPVETMYTFQALVMDSDNTTSGLNQVPVYATADALKFQTWGQTDFYLGDADLPFSYYPN